MEIFTAALIFIGSYLVGTAVGEVLPIRAIRVILFSLIGVLLILGVLSVLFK